MQKNGNYDVENGATYAVNNYTTVWGISKLVIMISWYTL